MKTIARIICRLVPLFHDWKFIHITPFIDNSWGEEVPSVFYTKRCTICGKLKHGSIYGCSAEKLEDLNQP